MNTAQLNVLFALTQCGWCAKRGWHNGVSARR